MSKIIGIDLGTTNSVVAVIESGEPMVIPNSEGGRTTPSVVAFAKNGERLVGQVAKRQAITNPENTIFSIKRFIGRRFTEVDRDKRLVPFAIAEASNGDIRVNIHGREFSPPEISAMILHKMRQSAEDYLGERIEKAVITVPAYFSDSQRQATKDAGKIAGLDVVRIINEPTAAALAYGLDKQQHQVIAVFDFGGGTFDLSILEVGDGIVEVKSTCGNTHLGGDDLDQRLIEHVIREFRREENIDLSNDKMALQRLKEAAEKAKIELSTLLETEVHLPFITADAGGPRHLSIQITRAKFEYLVDDLLKATLDICRTAMTDGAVSAKDVDEVVLVGGSSRIPKIQELVRELFGREPHRGVNPDEVVAVGAAIQGGVLSGVVRDLLLLDVTPLSLGIETLGSVFTKLIPKNTTIPTKRSEVFSTATDNQTSVEIHVLQGERSMAKNNRSLGRFHLVGIPAAPRGLPQVEVSFDIDANGILSVSARDLGTGKAQKITLTASSGLTKQEIDRMVEDAGQFAEDDKRHIEEIEIRNKADALTYSLERTLLEDRELLTEEEIQESEDAVLAMRSAVKDGELVRMRTAATDLTRISHQIAARLYSNVPPPTKRCIPPVHESFTAHSGSVT